MTGVSAVNLSYTQDALKYINGIGLDNTSSITDDVKGAISAVPTNAAFMGTFYTLGRLFKGTDKELFSIFGHTFHAPAGITGKGGLVKTTKNMFGVMTDSSIRGLLTKGNGIEGALKNTEIIDIVKSFSKQGLSSKEILDKFTAAKSKEGANYLKSLQTEAKTLTETSFVSKNANKFAKWVSSKIPQSAKSWIKTNIGGIKLGSKTVGEVAKSGANKFTKAFNSSGAGVMMVIDGVMALLTDVIPAFSEGGIGEGIKQTGKSAVKVGASAAGWAVGATLGKAAFATIGTLIGGPVGGFLGGAIGSFIGDMVGGTIGSAIAGKVTEKIVGEDYTDKVQNEQVANQAMMVVQDSATMQELNGYVEQLIQQDLADDGELTKDSEKMLAYLQNGAGYTSSGASNLAFTGSGSTSATNGLDNLVARIQAGDASVYDIPADVLEASRKSLTSMADEGFANNYTNFGYTNPYAPNASAGVTDYYAIG